MTSNKKEELNLSSDEVYDILEHLDTLFEQCDEDCPSEYRSRHLRTALRESLSLLCKYGMRIQTVEADEEDWDIDDEDDMMDEEWEDDE